MAALEIQKISDTGTAPDFEEVSATDTADIGSGLNTFLVYRNSGENPVNVTLHIPGNTFFGVPNADNVISVPDGGEAWIPLRRAYRDDAEGGHAVITTAGSSDLEVALVRLG